ncbi:hypothetical protein EHQ92_12360 [Leptospira biflexa]|uniref:Uncharacterized protein n=1 Tax=Leptospira biflexa serovar Patoc (strain Patoc 1 / ATCC 23582 / Paris) TaxID=456481 RepID=B0SS29_LEPBP|nr:hypothetical protein [Leptospira biflexa]ABZ94267.1 Conserved hypothetical protein [Leptospira biflexa serovar Patoc strain 'Patoc 1 (Ames)']ABZ97919.1 Conserved hypothetical protein [Leptospira biflexa serovar Patoc strain 'Patoc 1 (Paris)']TGM36799.1 hypothetical protein EHQ89_08760 [Leptospira biflexa]TGM39783.1 hypothetical protein EHQ80_00865 [Leptospira biflexa]TGM48625.1 hypothetical protein EHQ92_12360 [Leptospira biflexa]
MKTSYIWNLSQGRPFPVELWKHSKIKIQVNQIGLLELDQITITPNDIHILFLQVTFKEWKEIQSKIESQWEVSPFVPLILISSEDGTNQIQEIVQSHPKYLVLENPLHVRELRMILDRTIQSESYKAAALDIGNSCLENVGFFEGVFSLAHQEYEESKKENEALRSILQYEELVKRSQAGINSALEKVNDMKNQELIELHERVKAIQQLDELREKELKQALELQKATEEVLNYSRIEEMNLDKILRAQDRLFEYTEQEIKELVEENRALKKKLGLL